MAKTYRAGVLVRFNNAVMRLLIRTRASFSAFAILAVAGRTTGREIRTPLAMFADGDNRYLVATYGIVNWVRNLRAAHGRAELIRGRRAQAITAIELPADEAARILRASLRAGPPGVPRLIVRVYRRLLVLPFLDVDMESSSEEFERAALTHPVFLIRPQSGNRK